MRDPRLSIIIPARNEEQALAATLGSLKPGPSTEVIVVDGESEDATPRVACEAGALVVPAAPGRARQMNAGAAAARGEVLLFLHADTLLPGGYEAHIHAALERPGVIAGAFTLRIDATGLSIRVVERAVRWRARWRQMPYGDQAIFMAASTFRRLGGFSDLPIMEDYELMRQLRREGRVVIAPASVVTSGRRWTRGGVWRTTVINQMCVIAYRLGVAPARIATWRAAMTSRDRAFAGETASPVNATPPASLP